jgi:hypothetical protein
MRQRQLGEPGGRGGGGGGGEGVMAGPGALFWGV